MTPEEGSKTKSRVKANFTSNKIELMAKQELPEETIIDVVAICGAKKIIKSMTIKDWKSLVRKRGWSYIPYQKGYHAHHQEGVQPPGDRPDPKPMPGTPGTR